MNRSSSAMGASARMRDASRIESRSFASHEKVQRDRQNENTEGEERVAEVANDGADEERNGREQREDGRARMADGAERTWRIRHAPAHREQRRERQRVIRDEEERQDGNDLLELSGDHEYGRQKTAEQQRDVGRPPFVDLGRAFPEEAVAAHGEENARRDHHV